MNKENYNEINIPDKIASAKIFAVPNLEEIDHSNLSFTFSRSWRDAINLAALGINLL